MSDESFEPDPFPEQDDVEVRERKPVTVKGAAIVSARVVTGLVGIGVAVLAVAASSLLPLPTIAVAPAGQLVTPVPTAQQLVCPGALLRLSDETGQGATTPSAIGRALVRFAASEGTADATPLAQSDASTGGTLAAPTLVSTPPNSADPAQRVLLSGAQAQSVAEGDFVGLAAADCAVASGEAWLVGGSTAVGRTTLLTLSNPSEVAATVDLELFGEAGAIAAPGTSGIIVAPQGQRILSLAGFAPGIVSPVVHLTSVGGLVVASLQQSVVRGLEPGGVEIVSATAAPGVESIIPGLVVTDLAPVQELLGDGDAVEDVRTVVRLFAPGDEAVPVTVSLVPELAGGVGTSFELDVEAGRVTDVPIEELAAGSYTVRVQSGMPVLAAVRVTSASTELSDFAWAGPSAPLTDRAQLTVAPGPAPVLHLANPTDTDVTARVGDTDVIVAAGGSAQLPVTPGETYELSGFDTLFASVTLAEGGLIAHYSVHPPGVASGPITIYP